MSLGVHAHLEPSSLNRASTHGKATAGTRRVKNSEGIGAPDPAGLKRPSSHTDGDVKGRRGAHSTAKSLLQRLKSSEGAEGSSSQRGSDLKVHQWSRSKAQSPPQRVKTSEGTEGSSPSQRKQTEPATSTCAKSHARRAGSRGERRHAHKKPRESMSHSSP